MLADGLTTWAEHPEPTRSDCHAWSAHPALDLLRVVAGIRPGSAGFKTVVIEPGLGTAHSRDGPASTSARRHCRRVSADRTETHRRHHAPSRCDGGVSVEGHAPPTGRGRAAARTEDGVGDCYELRTTNLKSVVRSPQSAADRRPQTADRRPQTADRRPKTEDCRLIYRLRYSGLFRSSRSTSCCDQ